MVHVAASVFRVVQEHLLDHLDHIGSRVVQMLINIYWSMWHKTPEDLNVKQHLCEHLGSQNFVLFNVVRESTVMVDIGMVVLQNCMDLLKAPSDENEAIRVKVEEDIDVEDKQNAVAISFPKIKSEQAVSYFLCPLFFTGMSDCMDVS